MMLLSFSISHVGNGSLVVIVILGFRSILGYEGLPRVSNGASIS